MRKDTVFDPRQAMANKPYEIFHYYDSYVKEVGTHHHDFYELYCFVGGDVNYVIEGRSYALEPGDILLISPSELHKMSATNVMKYERYVLWMSEGFLTRLSTSESDLLLPFKRAAKSGRNLIRLSKNDKEKAFSLLRACFDASEKAGGYGNDILAQGKVAELLILLENEEKAVPKEKSDEDILKEKLLIFINEHLEDPELSIDAIAKSVFLSKSRIMHIFKESVDCPIHKYIIKKRLVLSKEYLAKNEHVIDVYEKCGFSDYNSFFRSFKKEYGITPKEYAKMMSVNG